MSKGLTIPWWIISFVIGVLWGALMTISIVMTDLHPDSKWYIGIAFCSIALFLGILFTALAKFK